MSDQITQIRLKGLKQLTKNQEDKLIKGLGVVGLTQSSRHPGIVLIWGEWPRDEIEKAIGTDVLDYYIVKHEKDPSLPFTA